jgi:hypothetical protein
VRHFFECIAPPIDAPPAKWRPVAQLAPLPAKHTLKVQTVPAIWALNVP